MQAFTEADAGRFSVFRAGVRDRRLGAMDRLIAAYAVSVSVTLVTSNEVDFSNDPGPVVKNWARTA